MPRCPRVASRPVTIETSSLYAAPVSPPAGRDSAAEGGRKSPSVRVRSLAQNVAGLQLRPEEVRAGAKPDGQGRLLIHLTVHLDVDVVAHRPLASGVAQVLVGWRAARHQRLECEVTAVAISCLDEAVAHHIRLARQHEHLDRTVVSSCRQSSVVGELRCEARPGRAGVPEARRGAAGALRDRRSYLKEDSLCSGS
eukprot:scaffold51456_cov63-Phaeocystis_antarctica.AAC.2